MTSIQTLEEAKRLAFMGRFKAHLLIIELENKKQRNSGEVVENHED